MTENTILCAYCQEFHADDPKAISIHVLECTKRPEFGLLLKIELLMQTGDRLLELVKRLVSSMATLEGMRTNSWDIYHDAKKQWDDVKDTTPEEMSATINQIQEDINNVEENSIRSE